MTESDAKLIVIPGPTTPRSRGSLSKFARYIGQQTGTGLELPVLGESGLPRWPGTVAELAERIANEYPRMVPRPKSLNAAFQLTAQRYLQRNGRALTDASLRNSWNQVRNKKRGYLK